MLSLFKHSIFSYASSFSKHKHLRQRDYSLLSCDPQQLFEAAFTLNSKNKHPLLADAETNMLKIRQFNDSPQVTCSFCVPSSTSQRSVRLSKYLTEMGMALSLSRSWGWPCAHWATCPMRWSWRLSSKDLTWMVGLSCSLCCNYSNM